MLYLMGGQPTLRSLLAWAGAQMSTETPALQHAASLTDEGGTPVMGQAAARYLNLAADHHCVQGHDHCKLHAPRDAQPDDWRALAGRKSAGRYLTPLRFAIEGIQPVERRLLLRDLAANVLSPLDVARWHGIPDWCAHDVIYRSLTILRERFREFEPVPERGWISGRSDAQRDAESAA